MGRHAPRRRPSPEADALYIGALQNPAWSARSAHLRNYYLTEVVKAQNTVQSSAISIPADLPE